MFDPVQLESFLAVAQTHNFTEAGRRLGLQQSTVSQHIRKLEESAGRRLFVRDTHRVTLTADGEAMTGFAQSIIDTNQRAARYFAGSQLRGRVRFGASEDFVSTRLPELLRDFMRQHALVDLELKVGVSATLYEYLDAGELDLVLAKRRAGEDRGQLVWRDRLAWVSAPGVRVEPPVPLILYNAPSITRAVGAGGGGTGGTDVADRLHQQQPEWAAGGVFGGVGRDSARARADAGGAGGDAGRVPVAGTGGCGVRGVGGSDGAARTGGGAGAGDFGEWGPVAACCLRRQWIPAISGIHLLAVQKRASLSRWAATAAGCRSASGRGSWSK